jgi:lysozyme
MLRGIDISAYQGDVDFAAVRTSGISFVYAKATQGLHEHDEHFAGYHDGARAAGLAFGAYHFLQLNEDGAAQADHFLAATEGRLGTLLPMVDVEDGGRGGVTDLTALVNCIAAFNQRLEEKLDCRVIVYSDMGDWNGFMQGTDSFSGHPFWVAEYNSDAAPTLPAGFNSWAIWQYSSKGSIPGIAGDVDLDQLNGDDLAVIEREVPADVKVHTTRDDSPSVERTAMTDAASYLASLVKKPDAPTEAAAVPPPRPTAVATAVGAAKDLGHGLLLAAGNAAETMIASVESSTLADLPQIEETVASTVLEFVPAWGRGIAAGFVQGVLSKGTPHLDDTIKALFGVAMLRIAAITGATAPTQ